MSGPEERLLALWPTPQSVERTGGVLQVARDTVWLVSGSDPGATALAGGLAAELSQAGHTALLGDCAQSEVAGGNHSSSHSRLSVALRVDPRAVTRPQGYALRLSRTGARITAHDPAGLFYGTRTLMQLFGRGGDAFSLPCSVITDGPTFAARGFMLDVSRDKVPTLATLFMWVELLASLKVNQLQLYVEHSFAYRGHEAVWQDASPLTATEVQQLDAHCRAHFIELVPNQNSFGHMQRWLKHPRYRQLAECPEGFSHPWNPSGEPYGLCPTDPRSLALLSDLYDQLLPNFSSRQFNVGLDETLDLGVGRSREMCEREGTERVYLKFLREVHRMCSERGHTMQFWADIVLRRPELVRELPRDLVALEWGYEADHPFAAHAQVFADAGIAFDVCPGTSSWNTLGGRSANALANLAAAAQAGVTHGARGYLVTDWGDNGHWQPLPVSWLGVVAGAGLAWNAATPALEAGTVRALDAHVLCDRSGVTGAVLRDLGNAYRYAGVCPGNASALFGMLQHPQRELPAEVTVDALAQVTAFVEASARPLARASIDRADASLIAQEISWVRDALQCAAALGTQRLTGRAEPGLPDKVRALLAGHEANWLARNRPGGLSDASARFSNALACVQRAPG